MSRLKISDLSFCETELSSNSQVQGGVAPSFYVKKVILSSTTDSTGNNHTSYFVSDGTSSPSLGFADLANIDSPGFGVSVTTTDDGNTSSIRTKAVAATGDISNIFSS